MTVYKYILFLLLVAILATPFLYIENISSILLGYAGDNYTLASFLYIFLLVISVVVAPFAMPLFLVSGGIFGFMVAAIYNIIGWSLGAVIAFLSARLLGRPILSRFVSLKKIDEHEKKIPEKLEFFSIILLRMVIPVDLLSYALGFFSNVSFMRYTLATIIGITPFAIIFAYAGGALFEGKYCTIVILTLIMLFVFSIGYYFFNREQN